MRVRRHASRIRPILCCIYSVDSQKRLRLLCSQSVAGRYVSRGGLPIPYSQKKQPTMRSYPDLVSCGIRAMHFNFHVSGGLEEIDAFWEERGLDRSKERLLFAGYSRNGHPHTVYLNWARSHDECCDVYLGIEARRPSRVWPGRVLKAHRLRESDLREFLKFIRQKDVPWGIHARYIYPSPGPAIPARPPSNTRLRSLSFEVLEEERTAAILTFGRQGEQWFMIVEPTTRFPFPKGNNFFREPFETGCALSPPASTEQTP